MMFAVVLKSERNESEKNYYYANDDFNDRQMI